MVSKHIFFLFGFLFALSLLFFRLHLVEGQDTIKEWYRRIEKKEPKGLIKLLLSKEEISFSHSMSLEMRVATNEIQTARTTARRTLWAVVLLGAFFFFLVGVDLCLFRTNPPRSSKKRKNEFLNYSIFFIGFLISSIALVFMGEIEIGVGLLAVTVLFFTILPYWYEPKLYEELKALFAKFFKKEAKSKESSEKKLSDSATSSTIFGLFTDDDDDDKK